MAAALAAAATTWLCDGGCGDTDAARNGLDCDCPPRADDMRLLLDDDNALDRLTDGWRLLSKTSPSSHLARETIFAVSLSSTKYW
mmetsp:Transcript_9451/g.24382  ORF Transcript_9451/g.24382 Transcript_9451/m.24382 type:complete len:85 (-) Transcript_9451:259-513(-)